MGATGGQEDGEERRNRGHRRMCEGGRGGGEEGRMGKRKRGKWQGRGSTQAPA